jgi:hypothetical protein
MNHKTGLAVGTAVAAAILAGCASTDYQTASAPPPSAPVVTSQPAVVTTQPQVVVTQPTTTVTSRAVLVSPAPGGHWEMRGAGGPTSPYYWVWVPAGQTIMTTAPPVVPQQVVVSSQPTIVTTNEGRWQLYGDGTRERPYMWYWVPRGFTAPPPPAIYRPETG